MSLPVALGLIDRDRQIHRNWPKAFDGTMVFLLFLVGTAFADFLRAF